MKKFLSLFSTSTLSGGKRSIAKALVLSSLIFFSFNCKENFTDPTFEPLIPANNDVNGGTWKTLVIDSAGAVTVAIPDSVSSDKYKAELSALGAIVASRTQSQVEQAKFWASGAVLRWNQIARKLVAKYNVAPLFNPDSNKVAVPFPVVEGPFTNPPVASRFYAYLSVAQYDALVAVWKAKYQFNRPRPSKSSSSISEAFAIPDIPSYPSEHSAIATVSAQMLKTFFPKEVAYIDRQLAEHKQSRLWAGANVQSDLDAGDSIATGVSARVIALSKTDGASAAGRPNTTKYPNYSPSRTSLLYGKDSSWMSLELFPVDTVIRPGMLPAWGAVKMWNGKMTESIRLPPPPKLTSDTFKLALAEVKDFSVNRTRDQWRIADYWADGGGTFTPPGHWNFLADSLCRSKNFNELRTARTMALMNMAIMDAGISCWDNKYFYVYPRPSQIDPEIKTATGIPNFPSYTSGHATFSGAGSAVLSYIFPDVAGSLKSFAEEAALSRLYGGIHYRFDNDLGLVCGRLVGGYIVDRGKLDGSDR